MMKDALALVGLAVLARKGYEFYCHYRDLKQENAFLRRQGGAARTTGEGAPPPTPQGA